MALRKKKISELPLAEALVGLFTIGVDALNRSVKVSLEFLKTAADAATTAANNANAKANAANSAASSANSAATAANSAATSANSAATSATNAATSANSAASSANNATANASQATNAANTAAASATQEANNASQAGEAATGAAASANAAANSASQATTSANTAATNANAKAGEAESKASDANDAAALANQKAQQANDTIIRLEELEESLVGQYKLIPTGMELDYPQTVTYRGIGSGKIIATLFPEDTGRNVLFLSAGGESVTVFPDGGFTVGSPGITYIHVIPTENTAIYKTIHIDVVAPALRKISATSLRFTGDGNLRLT
jgi:hypothetical protein